MNERTYTYIDGESHYIRSRECAKRIFGDKTELEHLMINPNYDQGNLGLGVHSRGHFFFDYTLYRGHRDYYFTSITGSDQDVYELQKVIREFNLDPQVKREPGDLAKRRASQLDRERIIEKPKGVDIALAARMLEDAYLDNYGTAMLFTSDVDFLPVIEAVRRIGRRVVVIGYKDGLGNNSPFLYAPDEFRDIGEHMRRAYMLKPNT
jgi:uncharacterized LabA/DUF88 family protein